MLQRVVEEEIFYVPERVVEYIPEQPRYYAPPAPVSYYGYDQRSPQGLVGGTVGSIMGYELGRGAPLAAGIGRRRGSLPLVIECTDSPAFSRRSVANRQQCVDG